MAPSVLPPQIPAMERLRQLFHERETHFWTVFGIVFITNCRYIGSHQEPASCGVVPLVFSCVSILAFACGKQGSRHLALRMAAAGVFVGGIVCTVLSCIHIHHFIAATVSILSAYVLFTVSIDIWSFQDNEVIMATNT